MPTFMELQKRLKGQNGLAVRLGGEEMLIPDVRDKMRSGDFIEQKLRAALRVEPAADRTGSEKSRSLSN